MLVDLCAASEKLDLPKIPESMKDIAYNELIMKETSHEVEEREEVLSDSKLTEEQKNERLMKLEQAYFRQRLVNANYYKDIKNLLTVKEIAKTNESV